MKIKRKKKSAAVVKIVFHIVVITLFLALASLTAYQTVQEAKKAREQVFEYVSLQDEAAAKAYVWLSQIEDMPFTYEDIKQMAGELRLTVVLTPAGEKGKFTQSLDEASYEACRKRSEEALEKAYRETVRHRFTEAGFEEEISDNMLDDMMREAYGVSVPEYLASCGVQLIPELQELSQIYSGEVMR